MKKLLSLIIFVSIILIIIFMTSYNKNPYAGKYTYEVNTNITLELNENNTFKLINAFNKDTEYAYGKYTVINNQIILTPDENTSFSFNNRTIIGKVEGSRITFSDFLNTKNCIFNKQ